MMRVAEKSIKVICLIFVLSFSLFAFQTSDLSRITGDWEIELEAEGEYFYLDMTVEESEGKLSGTISESSGFVYDIKLENIEYDGENFSFTFEAPTPPDGMERAVGGEFEVGENELEGFINVADLGISASALATRK
jgi:hypothetical protein